MGRTLAKPRMSRYVIELVSGDRDVSALADLAFMVTPRQAVDQLALEK